MNFIRQIVSGPKNRMQEEGYNLDLTYVTQRIIAMSFPANGFESLYRNPIEKVVKFIEDRHGINYLVINLSNRIYDKSKFRNQVLDYEWEDHHSPPINMLFLICQEIDNFLKKNQLNVVFVHCLAGKGRTGTIICCYLMYSGRILKPENALDYYSKKRFVKQGFGVNQPCQVRYVYYFHEILSKRNLYPCVLFGKQIVLKNIQENIRGKIYFQILDVKTQEQIINSQNDNLISQASDLRRTIKDKVIGRFSFNTGFLKQVNDTNIYNSTFKLSDLSPHGKAKAKYFQPDFEISLVMVSDCSCTNKTTYNKKCISKYEAAKKLFINADEDDIDDMLKLSEEQSIKMLSSRQVVFDYTSNQLKVQSELGYHPNNINTLTQQISFNFNPDHQRENDNQEDRKYLQCRNRVNGKHNIFEDSDESEQENQGNYLDNPDSDSHKIFIQNSKSFTIFQEKDIPVEEESQQYEFLLINKFRSSQNSDNRGENESFSSPYYNRLKNTTLSSYGQTSEFQTEHSIQNRVRHLNSENSYNPNSLNQKNDQIIESENIIEQNESILMKRYSFHTKLPYQSSLVDIPE